MDIASISAIVAAAGVLIGVVLAYLEIRNLVKARHTDLVLRLHSASFTDDMTQAWNKIDDSEFRDFDEYRKKYRMEAHKVCSLYETLGVLLHRKLIDADLVIDIFPYDRAWKKLEPYVKRRREQVSPKTWEWFEYLYIEGQKREQILPTPQ